MKTQSSVILTRVFFCQKCLDNKMPQKGQLFLTIGRRRQSYEVHQVTKNGRFGYSPSLIEKTHVQNGIVTIAVTCAMDGCESHIEYNESKDKYDVALLTTTIHTMPIREWNSLVAYTGDDDYTLD
jgi:hypothetical protein